MDNDEITCYSTSGTQIFSKSEKDMKTVGGLKTTHIKTAEPKYPKNPEFVISYDPYNSIFYTFTWPNDGNHYFPTPVLIGSDYKSSAEISYQKRMSLSSQAAKTMKDFGRWLLLEMNLLDNSHCPNHGRINDWLWSFAQTTNDLNKELNTNNDTIDKKKLSNKRAKVLTKMNKFNDMKKIFQKDKQSFEK